MAYFSNGTEGMMFEETFCCKCVHNNNCQVWDLHFLLNYDQFPEHEKLPSGKANAQTIKEILSALIMDDKDSMPLGLKCTMYFEKAKGVE